MTFQEYWVQTKIFINDIFSLDGDRANEEETVLGIKRGVEFKGINVWILIFAILIASIGLNLNSTAVIIGAMLISPLMGPIMGAGLALGIYDFELLKKSMKNLAVMVIVSIGASALYFAISPLSGPQSELIARTTPTIWDVFIGLFGGLAGIVAGSSVEKGNVVPGVAIATALMPPLCTAGYGLANASSEFFFGGFYLFIINTMFIALTAYFVVKLLGYKKKEFLDPVREKRVTMIIPIVAVLTIIPSIFLAINLVNETLIRNNVQRFIQNEIDQNRNQVLDSKIKKCEYLQYQDTLVLYMIGKELDSEDINVLREKLKLYQIPYELQINQDIISNEKIDVNALRDDVMKDLYQNNEAVIKVKNQQINDLKLRLDQYESKKINVAELTSEALVYHKNIEAMAIDIIEIYDSKNKKLDTVHMALIKSKRPMPRTEKEQYTLWLKNRLDADSLVVLLTK